MSHTTAPNQIANSSHDTVRACKGAATATS